MFLYIDPLKQGLKRSEVLKKRQDPMCFYT